MSALDELINHHDSVHHAFALDHDPLSIEAAAEFAQLRAELAQLRADLQAARERSAEQARQIDAARNVMIGVVGFFDYRPARAWLAANPAPQEQMP